MKDQSKTKQVLIKEISVLKQRIQELEQSETERKRMEQTYKDSELKYRSLIEHSSDVVFCVDKNGEYKFVNQVFASTFGKTPDFFLGKTFWDIYPKEHADHRQATSSKVFETGESQSVEVVVPLPDRTSYYIAKANPVRDETGKVVLNLTHAIDITERKQAEAELRKSEEKYRLIAENTADLISVLDMNLRFTYVSPASMRLRGFTVEEAMEQTLEQVLTPESMQLGLSVFEEEMQAEASGTSDPDRTRILELEEYKKDGSTIWMEVNLSFLRDKDSRPVAILIVSRDISERKRAEEAMQESEARYRQLFENAPVGIYEVDLTTGRIISVNDALCEYTGYTMDELLAINALDLLTEKSQKIFIERMAGYAVGEPVPSTLEYQARTKSGHEFWISINPKYFYKKGIPVRASVVAHDITERKQAEKALREANQKLNLHFEQTPMAVIEWDLDFRVTRWNHSAQNIFGFSPDEAIGQHASLIVPEEFRPHVDQVWQALLKIRGGERSTNQNVRKDGMMILCEWYNTPLVDERGAVTGAASLVQDVTVSMQAQEALRESENQLRTIVEGTQALLVSVDVNGHITYTNEATARAVGYASPEELIGKSYLHFIHPEDRQQVLDTFIKQVNSRNPSIMQEFRITDTEGKIKLFSFLSTLSIKDGQVVGRNGVAQDITERKRVEEEKRSLEERLNRAEKMESLGILAGGVAHDLNNVLGIVVGYAEMLLMGADKSSPIRSKLVNIMEGGQKAATIVGDLLTLARRGVSGRDVVNLNKIIADCQKSPEFEKLSSYNSAIKIKADLDPDLLNISGSFVHLNKTLFNLVSNATEAMKKGGCVTIKTINQYLDKPIHGYDKIQEGDYVILSVSDTGEGINADDIKRIFEPFYTKKVMGRSGTGLGLAVVWGTVKDHNGYINVESEECKGSTFTLYFPVTREELSAEHIAVSVSEYMGKGESILIVDDVEGQRELAEEMLTKLNYTVATASSGEKALAYLKEHKVDLMVLDMIMDPGMDGLDTYRQALGIHPKQKAIIVSGFSESDRVKAAKALGAGAYVRKPYVIEKLGLAVKKELDRSM